MPSQNILVEFGIKGLYGNVDITVPFNSNVKVLCNENAEYKSSTLSMLYYTLALKESYLLNIEWESIYVKVSNGEMWTSMAIYSHDVSHFLSFRQGIKRYFPLKMIYIDIGKQWFDPTSSHYLSVITNLNSTFISSIIKVCNSFDSNETIDIEERLFFFRDRYGKVLPLQYLSSGKKRIFYIFSTLYYHISRNPDKKFMILIDEPETSLSMEWQRRLLPIILSIPECRFLVAATHSPFIFENETDLSADVIYFTKNEQGD